MRFLGDPSLVLWSDEGELYLTRWELLRRRPAFAKLPLALRYFCDWRATLHHITGGDPDRGPHNHPWFGVCFVLRGGYWQIVRKADGRETISRVRWLNVLPLGEYHRIIIVSPNTWTLCFMGPRIRNWGFFRDGAHEDAAEQSES